MATFFPQGFIQIDDADVDAINLKSGTAFLVINFDASNDSSPVGKIDNESRLATYCS